MSNITSDHCAAAPKHLSLLLHGGDYPSPLTNGPTAQSLNLTVICDPGVADVQPPKFIAYDGSRLDLEWSTSAGCPFDDGDKKGDEKPDGDDKTPEKDKDKDVGRGLGFFFIVYVANHPLDYALLTPPNLVFCWHSRHTLVWGHTTTIPRMVQEVMI